MLLYVCKLSLFAVKIFLSCFAILVYTLFDRLSFLFYLLLVSVCAEYRFSISYIVTVSKIR